MGHFFFYYNPLFYLSESLISGLNMILSGPLRPNVSQVGEGVTETPIVSKGLRSG